ncbi:MAG: hypothetical protein KGL64_07890 [Acidobacteriota bacterium]|nr:hypothetical protein [Acidobacteriota bacterium]
MKESDSQDSLVPALSNGLGNEAPPCNNELADAQDMALSNQQLEEWITLVREKTVPQLLADQRLINGHRLNEKFASQVNAWRNGKSFRPIIETANELAAAECLLRSIGETGRLSYEPRMAGTKKRIDFLIEREQTLYEWVEVKTVAPQFIDDDASWQRYLRIAEEFSQSASFLTDRRYLGSAITGQAIKTRWSFIRYTAEVEASEVLVPAAMKGNPWLLFCSNGFDWTIKDLEDFADFYRTGSPREDDPWGNATVRFMHDAGITFRRTLAGFHYMERKNPNVSASCFRRNVRGPRFGADCGSEGEVRHWR